MAGKVVKEMINDVQTLTQTAKDVNLRIQEG